MAHCNANPAGMGFTRSCLTRQAECWKTANNIFDFNSSIDEAHPSSLVLYPEHFLLDYEDEGLIVVRIEVAHLYGCLLFLSDALALAIQELKFDVRV